MDYISTDNKHTIVEGYSLYFLLYLIYLEVSPKLGNIWIRCNSDNKLKICPSGIFLMLKAPFYNLYYWNPKFWDINFYAGGFLFTILLYYIKLNF